LLRAETNKVISDITRHVPFRLVSPSGNYIRIDKPLGFESIEDQLEVTHVKFQPSTTSSFQKILDTLLGDVSTGKKANSNENYFKMCFVIQVLKQKNRCY
jgi:hypothetical protein